MRRRSVNYIYESFSEGHKDIIAKIQQYCMQKKIYIKHKDSIMHTGEGEELKCRRIAVKSLAPILQASDIMIDAAIASGRLKLCPKGRRHNIIEIYDKPVLKQVSDEC